MSKRYYILFVAPGDDGQIKKVQIPIRYLYILLVGVGVGLFGLTGIASSYVRMLLKTSHFNQLRAEKNDLKTRYSRLEQEAKERDIQVASLGSLASEVSTLYGLKPTPILGSSSDEIQDTQVHTSLDRLAVLRTTALSGAATNGIAMGLTRNISLTDWIQLNSAPSLWPVEGLITGSFGERIDPFNGEGAFHRGVDISCGYGQPVLAPADGTVTFADEMSGYGRMVEIDHGRGMSTRYGHLASYSVVEGQRVLRGEVIGHVGLSGRSTGPHLHYEVRINDTPVNPHKYLRMTTADVRGFVTGS